MDWATSDHRPPTRAAAAGPALVHTYWRVVGVSESSRPITCTLHRTAAGFLEVRVGYTADDIMRSQVVRTRQAGDDYAATWKAAMLAKGFRELPPVA